AARIRLLRILILQIFEGYFFNSIGQNRSSGHVASNVRFARKRTKRITSGAHGSTWSSWCARLRRRRPKGGQRSLREISAELAPRGIMNERGKPFSAASIKSMLQA